MRPLSWYAEVYSLAPCTSRVNVLVMAVNPRRLWLSVPLMSLISRTKLTMLGAFQEHRIDGGKYFINIRMQLARCWAKRLFSELSEFIDPKSPNVPGALALVNSYFRDHIWKQCVCSGMFERITGSMHRIVESDGVPISISTVSNGALDSFFPCLIAFTPC